MSSSAVWAIVVACIGVVTALTLIFVALAEAFGYWSERGKIRARRRAGQTWK